MKRLSAVFLSFFFLAVPVNAETVIDKIENHNEAMRPGCIKEFNKSFPRKKIRNKNLHSDLGFGYCRGIELVSFSGMMTGVCIAKYSSSEFINKCEDALENFLSLPYKDTLNGDKPYEHDKAAESFSHYIEEYFLP